MTESINEIERARAKARQSHGLTAPGRTLPATLPEPSKGESREKVSRKIGMKPRTYDKAKKIWARAKVRQIRKPKSVTPTLAGQTRGESREKVSKKIGMKPRINTFADRIVLTESVKLIKD